MRYIIQAQANRHNGRVYICEVSEDVYPERLTFNRKRANVYESAFSDMGDALRLARAVYGLDFQIVPVCPEMSQEDFDQYRDEINSAAWNAFSGKLLELFTEGQAAMIHATGVNCALHAVPAFHNADVLRDYSRALMFHLARSVEAGERGIHEYSLQNKAS